MSNTRKKDNNIKKKKGFTLIELLAVIVVLGIVAGVSIVIYTGVKEKSEGKITEATKSNILSSSKDYTSEYLQDNEVWANATDEIVNGEHIKRNLYCITVKNLLDKGFLKKDLPSGVKPDDIIVIFKDENGKTTSSFIKDIENNGNVSENDCKGQMPDISLKITSTPNSDGSYYEPVNFKLELTDIGEIDNFYYKIKKGNTDNEYTCEKESRSCNGTVSGVGASGEVTITGYIERNGTVRSVDKTIKIDDVDPEIVFVADGNKGNNNWYVSNVNVSVRVKNKKTGNVLDSSLYPLDGICVSTNNSKCTNYSGSSNSVTIKEINSGKYICAKVTIGSKSDEKCTSYKVDTSIPTVTLSGNYNNNTGKVDVYGTFANDTSGLDKMAIFNSSISGDGCSSSRNSSFNSISGTGNMLIRSYSNTSNNSLWIKDKAGNCGKVISYYVGLKTGRTTKTDTNRPSVLNYDVNPNYKIKKMIFAEGILNSGSANYHVYTDQELKNGNYVAGIRFSYYNPGETNCDTKYGECHHNAYSYNATSSNECARWSSKPCPYGGKRSGSRCVANYGNSYIGSTNCTGNFQCSCKNSKCWWTYEVKPNCNNYLVKSNGDCYDGYSGYGITNTNPSQTSCSVSQANTWKNNWSYKYEAKCTWQGNYDAICASYDNEYKCDAGDYLSGSKCYSCGSNERQNGKKCYYDCNPVETCDYIYGQYAFMYIIDD